MEKPKRLLSYRHTLINSIGTFLSRLTGIIRWTVVTPMFGKSLDSFHASFKLINNLRKIVGEGVVTNAFIPVFQGKNTEDKEAADRFASNIINIFLLFTVVITIIGIFTAPYFIPLLVPGFEKGSQELKDSILLAKIMMPFVVFIFLFAVSMGILNSHKRFTTPAFAPLLFNLAGILIPVFFYKKIGIYSMGWGVLIGSLLMFLIEIIELIGVGFRYRFYINFRTPAIRQFFRLFVPTALNMGILMMLPIVFTLFGSFLERGAFTVLQNAQMLNQAPVGFVGVAIATVLLPLLSRPEIRDTPDQFEKALSEGFFMFFYLIVPITVFMVFFAPTVVNIAYRDLVMIVKGNTGKYTEALLRQTNISAAIYALAIPFMSVNVIIAKIFYSRHDAKTPLWANIIMVVASAAFYFLSRIPSLGMYGLAWADLLAAVLMTVYYFIRLIKIVNIKRVFSPIVKKIGLTFLLSGVGAAGLYPLYHKFYLTETSAWLRLAEGAGGFLLFAGFYFFTGKLLKLELKR